MGTLIPPFPRGRKRQAWSRTRRFFGFPRREANDLPAFWVVRNHCSASGLKPLCRYFEPIDIIVQW